VARVEIQYGPGFESRSEEFSRRCIERIDAGRPQSFVYLVPNDRHARHLAWRLVSDCARRATPELNVFSFNRFATYLLSAVSSEMLKGVRRISHAEKLVIVEETLRSRKKSSPLHDAHRFPGMVQRVSGLIAELKQNVCEDGNSFVAELGVGKARPMVRELGAVFDEYQRFLIEHSLADEEGKFLIVLDALKNDSSAILERLRDVERVFFDGFCDFTGAEKAILRELVRYVPEILVNIDFEENGRLCDGLEETFGFLEELSDEVNLVTSTEDQDVRPPLDDLARAILADDRCRPENIESAKKCLELRVLPTRRAEVREIASRVKQLAVDKGYEDKLDRIAVVFGAIESYGPVVREVFEDYGLPYSITEGFELRESPVVRAIFSFVALKTQGFRVDDVVACFRSPYLMPDASAEALRRCIVSARVTGSSKQEWFDKIERYARESDERVGVLEREDEDVPLRTSVLRDEALAVVEDLKRLFDAADHLCDGVPPETMKETLRDALSTVGIERNILSRHAFESEQWVVRRDVAAFQRFLRVVDNVCEAMAFRSDKVVTLARFEAALTSAVAGTKYSVPTRFDCGVTVGRPEDLLGIRFDYIFFGGLVEGEFPRRAPVHTLVSRSDRARSSYLRETGRQLEEGLYTFRRALRAAEKGLVATYPELAEDEPTVPSPFVREIERLTDCEGEKAPDPLFDTDPERLFSRKAALSRLGGLLCAPDTPDTRDESTALVARISDGQPNCAYDILQRVRSAHARSLDLLSEYDGNIRSKALLERLKATYGSRDYIFSVSQLEMYAKCPFRFFAERVLALKEPDKIPTEVEPMERGKLVHDILHKFMSRWDRDKRAGAETEKRRAAELIEAAAREVLGEHEFGEELGVPWDVFEQKLLDGLQDAPAELRGMLRDVVDHEVDKMAPAMKTYLEWEFGLPKAENRTRDPASSTQCLELGDTIKIRGRVDRIDLFEREEGTDCLVIDYKTGKTSYGEKAIKEGISYQMPVYMLAVAQLLPKAKEEDQPSGSAQYYHVLRGEGVKLRNKLEFNRGIEEVAVEHMRADVDALRSGHFAVTVLGRQTASCKWCPYSRMCRLDETRMARVDDHLARRHEPIAERFRGPK